MTLICGTIPDNNFPLSMGTWKVVGTKLEPVQVESFSSEASIPSLSIQRGTPALMAAALEASKACGLEPPISLLAGDCGNAAGSMSLYSFLSDFLLSNESNSIEVITFHYLFPSIDGHNQILMSLEKRKEKKPILIADAGFMYAAKMSGYAENFDVFTPDAGELAFLADEKAPHPFYTRGLFFTDGQNTDELARKAFIDHNSSHYLLIKGQSDAIVKEGNVVARVDTPLIPFMEPIGGTGDLVTGLLTVYAGLPITLEKSCELAARTARCVGEAVNPTPASSIAEFIPFIESIAAKTISN